MSFASLCVCTTSNFGHLFHVIIIYHHHHPARYMYVHKKLKTDKNEWYYPPPPPLRSPATYKSSSSSQSIWIRLINNVYSTARYIYCSSSSSSHGQQNHCTGPCNIPCKRWDHHFYLSSAAVAAAALCTTSRNKTKKRDQLCRLLLYEPNITYDIQSLSLNVKEDNEMKWIMWAMNSRAIVINQSEMLWAERMDRPKSRFSCM